MRALVRHLVQWQGSVGPVDKFPESMAIWPLVSDHAHNRLDGLDARARFNGHVNVKVKLPIGVNKLMTKSLAEKLSKVAVIGGCGEPQKA